MRLRLVLFLLFVLPAVRSHAQSAHWDPPGGALPVGQTTALRLVFEDCSPKDDLALPKVDGLTVQLVGKGSNTSIVNGTMSVSEVLTFAVALTKDQTVEIPSFIAQTNKGAVRVPAARFGAGSATVGRGGTPLSEAAAARLVAQPTTVWAGEVFDLTATVGAAKSYYPQLRRGFDWTPDPLIAETWSDPQQVEYNSGGQPHVGVSYRTRALVRSPGRFNLNAATHIVDLSVGVSGFGFFQQRQYDQYTITSNTPTLDVKALPAPPAGFSGAVGQFKLTSKIVPEKAAVGEPVTWTLELSGTGNWPDLAGLPARDVSNDFQVVQPKAKRTPAEGKVFDATLSEDVVLVPSKSGTYALGPVAFTYFDPKTGTYKTLTTPRTAVTITAPNAIQFNLSPQAAAPTAPPAPAEVAPSAPPTVPSPPAGIPRDPLPGSAAVRAPLAADTLLLGLLAPFAGLLLFWFFLALRRARKTDPLRAQREAHARLAATLAELRQSPPSGSQPSALSPQSPVSQLSTLNSQPQQLSQLLLQWQHDSAILWQIRHAAPPATALRDAAWAALWIESDGALYGPKSALPADWVARAEAALAAKRLPGFQPLRLFLPRNLFPFAALILLSLVPCSLSLGASDPLSTYRQGDFAAAEKAWADALARQPTDWIAHHNLSLVLAQQGRDGESASHAVAAFVQHPGDPAVQWHFVRASERAGFAPASLAAFLTPGPIQQLARRASPTDWQLVLIGAAVLAALALGVKLANVYGRQTPALAWSAGAMFTLAVVLAGTATLGLRAYGTAADARAVIVARAGTLRSIPTEIDTTQKTTVLPAGSLAVADKTFLSGRWVRLAFDNGQTGWVRRDEVVPLW